MEYVGTSVHIYEGMKFEARIPPVWSDYPPGINFLRGSHMEWAVVEVWTPPYPLYGFEDAKTFQLRPLTELDDLVVFRRPDNIDQVFITSMHVLNIGQYVPHKNLTARWELCQIRFARLHTFTTGETFRPDMKPFSAELQVNWKLGTEVIRSMKGNQRDIAQRLRVMSGWVHDPVQYLLLNLRSSEVYLEIDTSLLDSMEELHEMAMDSLRRDHERTPIWSAILVCQDHLADMMLDLASIVPNVDMDELDYLLQNPIRSDSDFPNNTLFGSR
jgi:hypothetical protein